MCTVASKNSERECVVRVGIIGSGRIGGNILAGAGHDDPDKLEALAAEA